jgi:hypothetical protein
VFLLCGVAAAMADVPPEWSVGVAAIKITPLKPVPLAGYAARIKPFDKVEQDIFAKALVLADEQGHRAVLVTMDLCILPKDVAENIRKRIAEQNHLKMAEVVLNVAHSHSAPAVSFQAAPTTGPTTRSVNAASAETVEYTHWLADRLVEVSAEAAKKLAPAKLSWGTGVANFVMNRREFTDRGVVLGVNPRGLVDRSVPVLRIDGADGQPRAIVFGYACHNTTTPSSSLGVGGDYAGYAQAYVQQKLPGVQAMFVIGCAGDSNPYPRQHVEDTAIHGQELGQEVCRVIEQKLKPVHGPLGVAQVEAELPLRVPDRAALEHIVKSGPALDRFTASQMLAHLDAGQTLPTVYRAPVSALQFGKDLTLVALPDEVVVGYVTDLEDALGPMRLWVAGYSNEVTGYIPTERILHQGGYETRGLYTQTGWFAPGVEKALVSAAEEAASKAGRPAGAEGAPTVPRP